MSKNKKATNSVAKEAAETKQAPSVEDKKETKVNVVEIGNIDFTKSQKSDGGLDANHQVDLLKMMHETYRVDPSAATRYGIPQEAVDKINRCTAIGQVAIFAHEILAGKSPFATSMRISQLEVIKEVAPLLGITIDTKALPAPKADGTVEVPSTAVKITAAAKKAATEEIKAAAKKTKDNPNDIENEQELKDALLKILVKGNGSNRFYDKVSTAINFYRAYLGIKANKEGDTESSEALKNKTNVDILSEIAKLLGKCTFTINGMAKFLFESTQRSKSPVSAFCTFRDASLNEKTGLPQIDDSLVADIVKVLINWYATSEIDAINKGIEILKKDEKKNKVAIDSELAKIKNYEEVISYVMNPSRDVADNFIKNYTDNKSEGFKAARMMASKILNSYYRGIDVKKADPTSLQNNVQQYVGVITNLFLSPLDKINDYSEANITEITINVEEEEGEPSKKAQD